MPELAQVKGSVRLSRNEQAHKFFKTLLHDDRSSYYIVQTSTAQKQWESIGALKLEQINDLEVELCDGLNFYVTHNGFTGKRALSDRVRQLNGLLFDLDCHNAENINQSKLLLQNKLYEAIRSSALPKPTMIVDTGRGYQLHYIFERSCSYRVKGGAVNTRLLKVVDAIRENLSLQLDQICKKVPGVDNDKRVANLNRVCRVPGTFNTSSGTYSKLLECSGVFWALHELNAVLDVQKPKTSPQTGLNDAFKPIDFNALCITRMRSAEALRDYREHDPNGRGCEGHSRNELMWFYFNAAMPVYGIEKAYELTCMFNQGFKKPLDKCEINATKRTLERVGHYRLTKEGVIRHLDLNEVEIKETNFFITKRLTERLAAKAKTKQNRAERDKAIWALIEQGYTYQQVADQLGISRRTVCNVTAKGKQSTNRKASKNRVLKFYGHRWSVKELFNVMNLATKQFYESKLSGAEDRVQFFGKQYIVCDSAISPEVLDPGVRVSGGVISRNYLGNFMKYPRLASDDTASNNLFRHLSTGPYEPVKTLMKKILMKGLSEP